LAHCESTLRQFSKILSKKMGKKFQIPLKFKRKKFYLHKRNVIRYKL
jgi:hypothetical protein